MTKHALLVHNTNARRGEAFDADTLLTDLQRLGYTADYCDCDEMPEADFNARLKEHSGLVLIVGGDGTIRATGLKLLNRSDIELAVIPAGTANNIANTLGLSLPSAGLFEALEHSSLVPFDVGRLRGVLGEHYFLESCGLGVVADMMAHYDTSEGKSVLRALRTMMQILPSYEGHAFELKLDGQLLSDRFVMVEALNTRSIGPRLRLAPEAIPSDGLLEVLTISSAESHGFIEYARQMRAERLAELENVEVHSVRSLELNWQGSALHVDDEVLAGLAQPEAEDGENVATAGGSLQIDLLPGALKFRVPNSALDGIYHPQSAPAAAGPQEDSNA